MNTEQSEAELKKFFDEHYTKIRIMVKIGQAFEVFRRWYLFHGHKEIIVDGRAYYPKSLYETWLMCG